MNPIEDLLERVETVERGLTSGEWIQQIIFDNEAYIVDMNVEDQLYEQGVNALGVSIDDYAKGHCHPRASSAKTRGFHTQLDEGPETP